VFLAVAARSTLQQAQENKKQNERSRGFNVETGAEKSVTLLPFFFFASDSHFIVVIKTVSTWCVYACARAYADQVYMIGASHSVSSCIPLFLFFLLTKAKSLFFSYTSFSHLYVR
jgi:hypothetical protein